MNGDWFEHSFDLDKKSREEVSLPFASFMCFVAKIHI